MNAETITKYYTQAVETFGFTEVNGEAFAIKECTNSTIMIFDHTEQARLFHRFAMLAMSLSAWCV